jgi:nucleoside-diphosphate-sugar epimerase
MYVSSIQVFGDWDGEVDRHSPVMPVSDYALSHWIAEQTVMAFARRLRRRTIVLRMAHAIGRGSDDEAIRWGTVPADFCRQAVTTGEIQLQSTGSQQRDFIDISEACGRILRILERLDDWDGSVRLIASGKGVSIRDMAVMVAGVSRRILGREPTVRLGEFSVREGAGRLEIRPETWNDVVLTGPSRSKQIEDSIESLLQAGLDRWK